VKDRKNVLLVILILSFLLLCSCYKPVSVVKNNSTVSEQNILDKVFAVGDHEVSIMEIALPDNESAKLTDISIRFQKSVEKNKEWYNEYINKHSSNGKLPWNENFGITKEEYDELISSTEKMSLIEKGKTIVSIVKEDDGVLTLKANQDLEYLSGIKIDALNNCLISESGVFKYSNDIEASDDQEITGPWSGSTWKLEFEEIKDLNSIDPDKVYGSINISVGQLEKTNQMMVYYKERVAYQGQSYKGEEIVIFNN